MGNEAEAKKPRWRKVSGGRHKLPSGITVVKGQVFSAFEWELGGHKHMYELIEDPSCPKTAVPGSTEDESLVALEIVHRTRGWYDVVNPKTGVKVNDRPLRAEEARLLAGGGEPKEEAAEATEMAPEASGTDEAGNDIDKEGE